MKRQNYFKIYRVFKNDTAVTEVSTNNFAPVVSRRFKIGLPVLPAIDVYCTFPCSEYSLLPDDEMFYGYLDKATAMEKAKSGALMHINLMIKEIDLRIKKLVQYRHEHHDDLNINLLDANIRRVKKEMNIK